MEDIMGLVGQIMSDPEQMKRFSALASNLGLSAETPSEKPPDSSESHPPAENTATPSLGGEWASLLPLIQKLQSGTDDKYITLLRALQPILSEKRRAKVDTAIWMLKLLTMVPYLEETGVIPKDHPLIRFLNGIKGVL